MAIVMWELFIDPDLSTIGSLDQQNWRRQLRRFGSIGQTLQRLNSFLFNESLTRIMNSRLQSLELRRMPRGALRQRVLLTRKSRKALIRTPGSWANP